MEDIIKYLKMNSRDDVVKFLKSLWIEQPEPCPLCGGQLDYFHKKAKKSNSDWICTGCGERFQAIKILGRIS